MVLTALAIAALVPQPMTKKVLVIGIDGCRPDVVASARVPNLSGLVAKGAWAVGKADPITVSGPCWSTVLCGVWDAKHGVRDNGFAGSRYSDYPDFLTLVERYRPDLRTVAVASWKPIVTNIVQRADVKGPPEGGDGAVAEQVRVELDRQSPDVMFVHFDDVDHAGHAYGYGKDVREYVQAIEKVDKQIGDILNEIAMRATNIVEDWLIIVVSDHGGSGTTHGQNIPEHVNILFIVSGKGAAKFTTIPNQTDVAPTVFAFLGIQPGPEVDWDGVPVGLKGIDSKALEGQREKGTVNFGASDDFSVGPLDVPLTVDAQRAEVRVTTDGSLPGLRSPIASSVHIEDASVLVRARAFRDGRPLGPSASRRFRSQKALFEAVGNVRTSPGLNYRVLQGKYATVEALDFSLSVRGGVSAVPTARAAGLADDFAIEFSGLVEVQQDGVYDFLLTSDDGSRLWIDGVLVVDHDGLHPPSSALGPVGLMKGWHRLRLVYFQAGGDMALRLAMGLRGTQPAEISVAGYAHEETGI